MAKQPPSPGDAFKAWRELVARDRFKRGDRTLVDAVDIFLTDRNVRSKRGEKGVSIKLADGATKQAAFTWYMTKRLIREFPNSSRGELWKMLDGQVLELIDHRQDDKELRFKLYVDFVTTQDDYKPADDRRQAVYEIVTCDGSNCDEKRTMQGTWRKWLPKIRNAIAKGT